jgi:hypothetical protein
MILIEADIAPKSAPILIVVIISGKLDIRYTQFWRNIFSLLKRPNRFRLVDLFYHTFLE